MKIVGLGDSNTWGYPFGPHYSWLHHVGNELSCQVINRGVNGECFPDMRWRLQEVINDQPDIVIVMGGVNDVFDWPTVQQVGEELTVIVDELQQKTSAQIIIGLPIPLGYPAEEMLLQECREWMRNFAKTRNLEVIDFYSALVDPKTGGILPDYNADEVHPNREGFMKMGELAVSRLKMIIR